MEDRLADGHCSHRRVRIFVWVFFHLLAAKGYSAEAAAKLCDVFRNPPTTPQTVLIAGMVQTSTHDLSLIDTDCGFRFKAGTQLWPIGLSLIPPGREHRSDPPARIVIDALSETLLEAIGKILRSAPDRARIRATIEGELRIQQAYRAVSSKDGYGVFGTFPGELIVKTVRDVEIVARPSDEDPGRSHGTQRGPAGRQ